MQVTLNIPDALASRLAPADVARQALEALAVEAHRTGLLTEAELGEMLGLSRYELDGFLKAREVYIPYSLEDLEKERETARRLGL
jgi:hypothetical protein